MKMKYSPPGPLPDVSEARIESLKAAYDPDYNLVKLPAYSMGYFTHYKGGELVHPIRESMELAWLLSLKYPANSTAQQIIEKTLQFQELDPTRDYFGVWPWFAEESLQEMDGIDYNWANFIGALLVDLLAFRTDSFPVELQNRMKRALRAACSSICKRNVPPNYTNICAMDSAVACAAGEILDLDEYFDYGYNSLRELYFRLSGYVVFDEYNSPAYTTILIEELDRLLRLVNHGPSRKMATRIRDWTWEGIATFFNNETMEWGGPHSRTYFDYCGKRQIRFLSDKAGLFGEVHSNQPCSLKARRLFTGKWKLPVMIHEKIPTGKKLSLWKEAGCQLGSISEGQTWVQGRPLIAHYRDGHNSIGSFRIRVLHDGRDYAGSSISCKQVDNFLLLGLRLGTGYGIWHQYMDRPLDGIIRPKDLRIRFEARSAEVEQIITNDNEGFHGLLDTPEYAIHFSTTGLWLDKELMWEKGSFMSNNEKSNEYDDDNWFPTNRDQGGSSPNSKWIDGVLKLEDGDEFEVANWTKFSFAAVIRITNKSRNKQMFSDKVPSIKDNGKCVECDFYKSPGVLRLHLKTEEKFSKINFSSAIRHFPRRAAEKLWYKFAIVRSAWASIKLTFRGIKDLIRSTC